MIVDIGITWKPSFFSWFSICRYSRLDQRKGSALIQDRIGANRASVLGLPVWAWSTSHRRPIKFLTKVSSLLRDKFPHRRPAWHCLPRW
jgi:hypothetical protein